MEQNDHYLYAVGSCLQFFRCSSAHSSTVYQQQHCCCHCVEGHRRWTAHHVDNSQPLNTHYCLCLNSRAFWLGEMHRGRTSDKLQRGSSDLRNGAPEQPSRVWMLTIAVRPFVIETNTKCKLVSIKIHAHGAVHHLGDPKTGVSCSLAPPTTTGAVCLLPAAC
jgi:hypothetical protein